MLIRQDRVEEGDEDLYLLLADPSRPALLGTPAWAQVRIKDDDAS